jgi:hypothetical protein
MPGGSRIGQGLEFGDAEAPEGGRFGGFRWLIRPGSWAVCASASAVWRAIRRAKRCQLNNVRDLPHSTYSMRNGRAMVECSRATIAPMNVPCQALTHHPYLRGSRIGWGLEFGDAEAPEGGRFGSVRWLSRPGSWASMRLRHLARHPTCKAIPIK